MKRLATALAFQALLLIAGVPASSQSNERNCPATTAVPEFVGPGIGNFSPNQNLCLPRLAPIGGPLGPLAFIVRGVEPGDRVDLQGTVYVVSIRGVPGGVDLWRWAPLIDPPANANQTLPFKYEGQPDNCGILTDGCANNVDNLTNPGVAPGGGDADIAVNAPDPITHVPNLPLTSLTLAPGVTGTHSTNRGDNFSPPNPLVALIPVDDRQWNDAIDPKTVYLVYHDIGTFQIDVQRSNNGGVTYVNGFGQAIDPQTFPAAGGVPATNSANLLGQVRIDQNRSKCPSRGNLYQLFVAPDNLPENLAGGSLRSVYVGISRDAKFGLSTFMFRDHKIFTSPAGSLGATNGTANIFPALATDNFGFVYAVWSDNSNIFFSSSSDHGSTWSTPSRVNQGTTVGMANVFPWVAADANGHVVVAWLGANKAGNSNDQTVMEPCPAGSTTCMTDWAQWNVYVAEAVNGNAAFPTFTQFTASDHVIHRGTVSTGGLGGGANRNLADFFQVALDGQHRVNIAFADDHVVSPLCNPSHCGDDDPMSRRVGVPYFTRQVQANSSVVTTGACAGAQQQEAEEEDQGDGEDADHDAVGFVDRQSPENGTLVYNDPSSGLSLQSSNGVSGVSYNGSCVTFGGSAKVNGQLDYQFTFGACDLSALGTGIGNFSISVTGPSGFYYQKSGTLTSGFVKLHVPL